MECHSPVAPHRSRLAATMPLKRPRMGEAPKCPVPGPLPPALRLRDGEKDIDECARRLPPRDHPSAWDGTKHQSAAQKPQVERLRSIEVDHGPSGPMPGLPVAASTMAQERHSGTPVDLLLVALMVVGDATVLSLPRGSCPWRRLIVNDDGSRQQGQDFLGGKTNYVLVLGVVCRRAVFLRPTLHHKYPP